MLWKILSGLAAIALAVGVWFSLQNKQAITEEREAAKRAKDNLKSATEKIAIGNEKKATREKELADLQKQKDALEADVAKVKTDTDQKVAEAEIVKKQVDDVSKQLAALKKQIDDAGDIKKLLAKVEELNTQKKAAEVKAANQLQQLAHADDRLNKLNAEILRLEEADKRQRAGVVEPGFTARVSQPYQNFGFVILNKGNLGGMFANAVLDVKRGSRAIARLKVRDVEQAMSVADLVPGTMAQGETIRSGDLVVAAKLPPPAETPAVPPTGTPAPGGAAPAPGAPPAAPGADPFGGAPGMAPPTPAPAPAATDPFGGAPAAGGMAPAPAAPAPAPAGADPFGGAPAAPAPAGAAPAPTAPAAPAAPAPGAPAAPAAPGTTPDPFSPPAGTPPTPPPPAK